MMHAMVDELEMRWWFRYVGGNIVEDMDMKSIYLLIPPYISRSHHLAIHPPWYPLLFPPYSTFKSQFKIPSDQYWFTVSIQWWWRSPPWRWWTRCYRSIRGCWSQWWSKRNPRWFTRWYFEAHGMIFFPQFSLPISPYFGLSPTFSLHIPKPPISTPATYTLTPNINKI